MAVRPHDQEIGIELGHLGQQSIRDRKGREFVPDHSRLGVQAMSPEMEDQVFGELYVRIFLRIDQQDSHRTRHRQQRQRILNRPAGFAAAVPSDQHILAYPVEATAGIGHDSTGRLQRDDIFRSIHPVE